MEFSTDRDKMQKADGRPKALDLQKGHASFLFNQLFGTKPTHMRTVPLQYIAPDSKRKRDPNPEKGQQWVQYTALANGRGTYDLYEEVTSASVSFSGQSAATARPLEGMKDLSLQAAREKLIEIETRLIDTHFAEVGEHYREKFMKTFPNGKSVSAHPKNIKVRLNN